MSATGPDASPGLYELSGVWYREVYNAASSEGGVIMVVTEVNPHTFIVAPTTFTLPLGQPPQNALVPPTDTQSPWVVRFERTGLNTYAVTSLSHVANTQAPSGQPQTAWALPCNGTAVQTADDVLIVDWSCFASCNPCYPGCWNYGSPYIECDPDRLWNPFTDPTSVCAGGAHTEFRKMPMNDTCVP